MLLHILCSAVLGRLIISDIRVPILSFNDLDYLVAYLKNFFTNGKPVLFFSVLFLTLPDFEFHQKAFQKKSFSLCIFQEFVLNAIDNFVFQIYAECKHKHLHLVNKLLVTHFTMRKKETPNLFCQDFSILTILPTLQH